MDLEKFFADNPALLETKVGDGTGNVADIKIAGDGSKALNVKVADPVATTLNPIVGSAVTRVPSSTSSQILIAANAVRKGLLLYNDSGNMQFVKFGATATTIDFTIRLTTQSFYEMQNPVYNGRIDVVSSGTGGAIQITELF